MDSSPSNIPLVASSVPPTYSTSSPFGSCGGSASINPNAVGLMTTATNQFFTLPSYNFGIYPSGFSIAFWFQPNSIVSSYESLFVIGAGNRTTNILFQRAQYIY
jgi:hypothetical protein